MRPRRQARGREWRHGAVAIALLLGAACSGDDGTGTSRPVRLDVVPNPASMDQKGTLRLEARAVDSKGRPADDGAIQFSSDNPLIATVSTDGLVQSVGPAGSLTVSVQSTTLSASVPLTVRQKAAELRVDPADLTMLRGQRKRLTVRVIDQIGLDVVGATATFTAANPQLVTVAANGDVTAGTTLGATAITVSAGGLSVPVPVSVALVTHPDGIVAGELRAAIQAVAISAGGLVLATAPGQPVYRFPVEDPTLSAVVDGAVGGRGIAIDAATATAFVSGADFKIQFIDLAANRTTATLPLSGFSHELRLSPDGRSLYVGDATGLAVIDVPSRTVLTTIETRGVGREHLALHPTRPLIYVDGNVNSLTHSVVEVDVVARAVTRQIIFEPFFPPPIAFTGNQMAISRDGRRLYAANSNFGRDGSIEVLDLESGMWVDSIRLPGCTAWGLAMTADERQFYVGCMWQGRVDVLDLASRRVIRSFFGFTEPASLASSSDGAYIVVGAKAPGVTVIR